MCESLDGRDEPEVECAEFESFPCPEDDDDGAAATAGDAMDDLDALGACDWPVSSGTWVFAYSKGRQEVDWGGTTYSVSVSGATLSASIGTWTIYKRDDGIYRVGDTKAAIRFVPSSGSPKARVVVQN